MKDVYKYPPFTAEKQLELIKWLSDTDYYIHTLYKTIDTKEYCIENDFYNVQANDFEEALLIAPLLLLLAVLSITILLVLDVPFNVNVP